MRNYIIKKLLLHGCISACLCVLMGLFSRGEWLYAGFTAAFLGAAYLLAGWLRWLRAGGTDVLRLVRRKNAHQVPYFHQRDKQKIPGIWPGKGKFVYEDSLESEAQERYDSEVPPGKRLQADAAAFGLCGVALLVISLFI